MNLSVVVFLYSKLNLGQWDEVAVLEHKLHCKHYQQKPVLKWENRSLQSLKAQTHDQALEQEDANVDGIRNGYRWSNHKSQENKREHI